MMWLSVCGLLPLEGPTVPGSSSFDPCAALIVAHAHADVTALPIPEECSQLTRPRHFGLGFHTLGNANNSRLGKVLSCRMDVVRTAQDQAELVVERIVRAGVQ
eukprot:scaffold1291_cov412-Prasinococcus_capsulatus_cf.AAC.16